ncbi:MAG: tetratricopeptide repeat protein [candidate division NC10 bacterium]|nr:tetratricopeptide repeat protein [candidate division NC10 bacterium]MBI2114225.1 tetratricopeptide repeat protein [candidate division NC10 bacterium]MBI2564200.1 tetratricopeptide repeat protein [candidate division NC10 bacterium]MBI3122244.1 tetratricopeptide repeat protein [candidate division NC10 bacterium]
MTGQSRKQANIGAVLLLGLAVLFGGCGGTTWSQVTEKFEEGYRAQRSYEDGLERYRARDYAGAIPLLQRALALEPTFDDAQAHLAWSYYHAADYAQATRHFRLTIERQPRWEGLYNGLGWSRYRVGRYHLAAEAFREALDLDARYRDAAVGLAYSLFELGQYAEALPHLERLTKEGEGHALQTPTRDVEDVRSRYAWTLFYLAQYGKAREQFLKGLAARPDWHGLHNGLGWTSLKLGDRIRARAEFRRALQLQADLADAKEGLAQAGR